MDAETLTFESASEYKHLENAPIAFFCAEYALDEDSSMYAGGLGVLAGDFILESADENLPFVAIGLWYGGPKSAARVKEFSPVKKDGVLVAVEVPYKEEMIKARVWACRFQKSAYLFLLDADLPENSPENRRVTGRLYDPAFQASMKQELLLGLGGVKLLSQLGLKPSIYHLNEGHTAFAALELMMGYLADHQIRDVKTAQTAVKKIITATKHTIFSIAGPSVSKEDFVALVGPYCRRNGISADELFKIGENKNMKKVFSTTQFLLNCAERQNGVSVLHTAFEKLVHPHSILFPITNGVYIKRWQAEAWHESPEGGERLTDDAVWKIKQDLRQRLIDFVAKETGITLESDACIVVWARRFTQYKRPELLFSNLARLKKICLGHAKIRFIISGQAHESDTEGKRVIEKIKNIIKDPVFSGKIVYLADYSIAVAKKLVWGADVWLNTPQRGYEACGTSGMKAGLNGALQTSTADGWIDEVDWSGAGFVLPGDGTAKDVYNTLEAKIAPLFYKRDSQGLPLEWIRRMRETQNIIESRFTARRMLRDYLVKSYLVL